jgi:hypothetical protein
VITGFSLTCQVDAVLLRYAAEAMPELEEDAEVEGEIEVVGVAAVEGGVEVEMETWVVRVAASEERAEEEVEAGELRRSAT